MVSKLKPETKAEIVIHFEHEMTQKEISELIKVSQSTVSKTIKRFNKRCVFTQKLESGRKKSLSSSDLEYLEAEIEKDPKIGSSKLKIKLAEEIKKPVSDQTICRNLCYINLYGQLHAKNHFYQKLILKKGLSILKHG